MMVSNGNVTGLAASLVADGWVERRAHATDRRTQFLTLTAQGRAVFGRQSAAHEQWIADLFGGISQHDRASLYRLLGVVKARVRRALEEGAE
jgi:DNA-binding MarR family transcriptional regulator